jgi:serine/threonine protein kinase
MLSSGICLQAIMYQVLQAIGYAHMNCVMHRDLKPQNILVDSKRWASEEHSQIGADTSIDCGSPGCMAITALP